MGNLLYVVSIVELTGAKVTNLNFLVSCDGKVKGKVMIFYNLTIYHLGMVHSVLVHFIRPVLL